MIKVEEVKPHFYYRIWSGTEKFGDKLVGEVFLDEESNYYIVTNHVVEPYKPVKTRYPAKHILNKEVAFKTYAMSNVQNA